MPGTSASVPLVVCDAAVSRLPRPTSPSAVSSFLFSPSSGAEGGTRARQQVSLGSSQAPSCKRRKTINSCRSTVAHGGRGAEGKPRSRTTVRGAWARAGRGVRRSAVRLELGFVYEQVHPSLPKSPSSALVQSRRLLRVQPGERQAAGRRLWPLALSCGLSVSCETGGETSDCGRDIAGRDGAPGGCGRFRLSPSTLSGLGGPFAVRPARSRAIARDDVNLTGRVALAMAREPCATPSFAALRGHRRRGHGEQVLRREARPRPSPAPGRHRLHDTGRLYREGQPVERRSPRTRPWRQQAAALPPSRPSSPA